MNYLKRTMLALAKTGDTEMTRLFRRFNARLAQVLTHREIDTYARYLLAPAASVSGAPPTFAEQAVCRKVQADATAAGLGKQIVAALATRKRAMHGGFGRN
jgi:hypothetical protein